MAKFRFYITNLFEGEIEGTNDAAKASEFAECEDYFVVDSETGERMCPENSRVDVKERA